MNNLIERLAEVIDQQSLTTMETLSQNTGDKSFETLADDAKARVNNAWRDLERIKKQARISATVMELDV